MLVERREADMSALGRHDLTVGHLHRDAQAGTRSQDSSDASIGHSGRTEPHDIVRAEDIEGDHLRREVVEHGQGHAE